VEDFTVRAVFRSRSFAEDFEGEFKLPFAATNWAITLDPTNQLNHVLASSGQDQNWITNAVSLVLRVTDGIGSFDFGVSTETNYDRLEFSVAYLQDGQAGSPALLGAWSGEQRGRHEFALRAGTARLEWRYRKDAALSGGADQVFVDNLDLPLFAADSALSVKNATVTLRISGMGQQSLRIEASSDLRAWSPAGTTMPDSAGVVTFQEAAGGQRRFYRFIPLTSP
jgi:hypothetical protein